MSTTLLRLASAPPVRIVHLGLGAFSRSHTAWYTEHASDAAEWGIAAYTGRSRDLADRLSAQNGLYTLVERDEGADRGEVIGSIVRAHAGDDLRSLVADLVAAETAIVTLTITEAGYRLRPDDEPDFDDPLVVRDIGELHEVCAERVDLSDARPETAPGRLLLGLEARRRAGSGPLSVVSCDNLPDNGGRLARGVSAWAGAASPELREWIHANVSFVSSSVDRITPRISDEEHQELAATYGDDVPVVTEPFRDWVLSGDFVAGRPGWENAGARFVDDLEPWEARKLWLLNGAHTLLAGLGLLRGRETVAEAMDDPVCRAAVEDLWNDAEAALPLGMSIADYRAALADRFANPRIAHRLRQIALDARTKVRLRIVPVAEVERRNGRDAAGCAFAIASWIVSNAEGALPAEASTPARGAATDALSEVSRVLAADDAFVGLVERAVRSLSR